MKLSSLLHPSEIENPKLLQENDKEVSHITADSREVKHGSIFFSVLGAKFDARVFINESFDRGAVAVVYDGELNIPPKGLAIQVKDVRRALSAAASRFYGEPSKKLHNIAITGTSGKTSVAWIISHALHSLGSPTFLGGTLGFKLLEKGDAAAKGIKEQSNTTMDPISVQRFLADALESGAKNSVFEATSQGVVQSRMRDVSWDGAIFTNISREHMDLHGTMEKYEAAKRELFVEDLAKSPKQNKFAIFNFDDDAARRISFELKAMKPEIKVVTFSRDSKSGADYILTDFHADTQGLSFSLKSKETTIPIKSPLVGSHNGYNLTCAALALKESGFSETEITKAISAVPAVPGRLEPVYGQGKSIYVDYAHKPDALEKVLTFLKPLCKGRLISVFGCGGDRDKGKRAVMGEISRRIADVTIVTSDNPRTEEPEEIIKQIVSGIENKEQYSLIIEADRKKAISEAIKIAAPDDIILIAGKGHEPYQEIQGVKYPFHDVRVAQEILAASK